MKHFCSIFLLSFLSLVPVLEAYPACGRGTWLSNIYRKPGEWLQRSEVALKVHIAETPAKSTCGSSMQYCKVEGDLKLKGQIKEILHWNEESEKKLHTQIKIEQGECGMLLPSKPGDYWVFGLSASQKGGNEADPLSQKEDTLLIQAWFSVEDVPDISTKYIVDVASFGAASYYEYFSRVLPEIKRAKIRDRERDSKQYEFEVKASAAIESIRNRLSKIEERLGSLEK